MFLIYLQFLVNSGNHFVKNVTVKFKFLSFRISDVVLKINNMDVTNVDKRTVLQSLKNSSHVSLVIIFFIVNVFLPFLILF